MNAVYLVEFLVSYLCELPYFFHGCGGSDFIVVVFELEHSSGSRAKPDKGTLPEVSSWAPDFWRLSRKHFRVVLGDGRFVKPSKFENRLSQKERTGMNSTLNLMLLSKGQKKGLFDAVSALCQLVYFQPNLLAIAAMSLALIL
jgi:hypothetical protein